MTIGLNISGGEFGGTGGVHNHEYHYPTYSELKFYKDKGVDLVRLPFTWERMQHALNGPLDTAGDLQILKQVLVDAASLGMDVIIDNHNYGRFNGVALGASGGPSPAQFADFWKKMAAELKDYPALVGYDLMNEPHDMPSATIWKESAQAATNAIRTVDAANTIIIEGDNWSSAFSWASSNNAKLIINDPANNIVYQAHQYLDRNSSGIYQGSYDQEGAYANVGVDRLKPFVEWLNANGLKGMIGEFGVPSNDGRWLDAQKNMLNYMISNDLDGTAWGGGAWWPTSYAMFTAAPGRSDSAFGNSLEAFYGQFDGFGTGSPQPPSPPGIPSVAVGDLTVSESAGAATFTITRAGDLSKTSSVNYSTANGTAFAGSDYAAVAGVIHFAIGEATKKVSVAIVNDTQVESSENFMIKLSAGSNVSLSDSSGTITIVDNDGGSNTSSVIPPEDFPNSPTIFGTDSNDNINANASAIDYIDGRGGDDFFSGVGSKDFINGNSGSDTVSYHWSGAFVDVDLLRDSQLNGDANGDVLLNIENVRGSGHNDRLAGDDLANLINGLGGRDILSGRGGSDKFVFDSVSDANGDWVTDFALGDKLDFSAMDANYKLAGNQAFTWLDSGQFTGSAGQLREYDFNGSHYVAGDVNGDSVADFTIKVSGSQNLSSGDIFL